MTSVGAELRSLREDAALTQEELADRSGLSVRTISDIERGKRRRLYLDTAERLADTLDLTEERRAQFIDVARGRLAVMSRELDVGFKRRFVAWHVDRVSSLSDRVGHEELWFSVLDADQANLDVALRWADEAGDGDSLLALGAGLFRYWQARGALADGRHWLERGLLTTPTASSGARAAALWGLAWLAYQQGDDAAAADCARELKQLADQDADPVEHRNAATVRGIVALAREDTPTAILEFEHALRAAEDLSDPWLFATSQLNLAIACISAGDTAAARRYIGHAIRTYEDLGDERFRARSLGYLGLAALVDGDAERAESLYAQSLLTFEELGEGKGTAESLTGLATAAAIRGLPIRAAQLAGAAERIREGFAGRALPVERRLADERFSAYTAAPHDAGWTTAWTSGRALRDAEAIAVALDHLHP